MAQGKWVRNIPITTTDDRGVLETFLIMLETLNLAHMFGGTWDHKLLGHWAEGPPKKPSAGARMKGA